MKKITKKTTKKVTKKTTKAVTIKLELGEYADSLWHTSVYNFIGGQPEQFVHLEGKKMTKGTLFYCDSYLEAQVLRAYIKAKSKFETGLYRDDKHYDWVVASPEKFKD